MLSIAVSSSVVSPTAVEDERALAIGTVALGFADGEVVPVLGSQSQPDDAAGEAAAPSSFAAAGGPGRLVPLGSTLLDSPSESTVSDEVARTLVDGLSEVDNPGVEEMSGEHSFAVVGAEPGGDCVVVVDSPSPTLLLSSPECAPAETALSVSAASPVAVPTSSTSSSRCEHGQADRGVTRGGGNETLLSSVAAAPDRVVVFRGNCRFRPYRWPARAESGVSGEAFVAAPPPAAAPLSAGRAPRPDPFSVFW